MNKRYVLDSSIYLIYTSYNKIFRLAKAVDVYGLVLLVNNDLLNEVYKNAPKVIKVKGLTAEDVLDAVRDITVYVNTVRQFTTCPDPKDNFLFDIALQTRSEVIVTQEKALLSFTQSPVAIHDLKWFKETYPVDL